MSKKSVSDSIFVQALGQVCIRHRKNLGMSQSEFALDIGMDVSNYQCIELGRNSKGEPTNPQTRTVLAIARGLGLTPAELYNEVWELALTME